MNKGKNSIVDPRVTVEIYGVQQDSDKKQTRVIENNGKGEFSFGEQSQDIVIHT